MPHNFRHGIDYDGDPTGETPLPNSLFISKNGSNANSGTDPNAPVLTIQRLMDVSVDSTLRWCFGAGVWSEQNINFSNSAITVNPFIEMIGLDRGQTILQGSGSNRLFAFDMETENGVWKYRYMQILDYEFLSDKNLTSDHTRPYQFDECLVRGLQMRANPSSFANNISAWYISKSIFLDCRLIYNGSFNVPTQATADNIFINSPAILCFAVIRSFFDSALDMVTADDTPQFPGEGSFGVSNNNNIRSTISIRGENFSDLSSQRNGRPDQNINSIDLLPLFEDTPRAIYAPGSGSPHSPLTLGDPARIGGQSPVRWLNANDIVDDSILTNILIGSEGEFYVEAGFSEGTIETNPIARAEYKGENLLARWVNFSESTPANDNKSLNTRSPSQLTYEFKVGATLAEINNRPYRLYRYGDKPFFNSDGTTSGQEGFNWGELLTFDANETIRFVQYKIIIRNNFIA